MALSPKTVSTFQQEYTSTGAEKIQEELQVTLGLLERLRDAQAQLRVTAQGAGKLSEEVKKLKDDIALFKDRLKLQEDYINTLKGIDRVQKDSVITQDVQSRQAEELDKQRQRGLATMAKEEDALRRQQELLRKDLAFQRAVRGAYNNFSPEEQRRIASNPVLRQAIQASTVIDHLSQLRETVARKIDRSRGELLTTSSPERAKAIKEEIALREKQLQTLSRGIQQNERFVRSQERLTRSQLNSLDPLTQATQGWGKLQTVFIRVKDALLSFLLINAVAGAVRGFFTSIVESNAQLEVLNVRLSAISTGSRGSFEELKKHILDLTIHTPFVIKDFMEATVTLKAFGVSALRYLAPVADWAAAVGRNIDDVSVAFAKVATGSPRTALLLSTRGISKAEFDEELLKTHDRALALANIIDRRYGDLARKVSKTFEGFVSNIKDVWFQIAAALGEEIFQSLRKDAESFFNALKSLIPKEGEDPSIWITSIANTIRYLYESVKVAMPFLIAFAAIWTARSIVTGIGFVMFQFSKMSDVVRNLGLIVAEVFGGATTQKGLIAKVAGTRAVLGALTPILTSVIALFGTLAIASSSFGASMERLADGRKRLSELMKDEEPGSQALIRALEDQVRELEDATDGWEKYWLALGRGPGAIARARMEEELKVLTEILKKNREIAEAEKARRKALLDATPSLEAFQLREVFAGKEGGLDVLSAMNKEFQKLRENWNWTDSGLFAGHNVVDPQEKKAFEVLGDVFAKLFTPEAEQRANVIKEAISGIKEQLKGMIGLEDATATKALELIGELAERLIDKTKDGKRETRDYRDEIEGLIASIAALNGGQSLLDAQEAKSLARLEELRKNLGMTASGFALVAEAKDKLKPKDQFELLSALLAALTIEEKKEQKLIDLRREYLEVTEELVKAQSEYQQAVAQNAFEQDANLSAIKGSLSAEKEKLLLQRQGLLNESAFTNLALEQARSPDTQLKLIILLQQQKKRLAEIDQEILDINRELFNLPVQSFHEGWKRAILDLRHELLGFHEEFAKVVETGIRETVVGIIKDSIFGAGDDTAQQLEELRLELASIQQERIAETGFLQTLRRQDGESLAAYIERTQRAQELVQQQAQVSEFQTKELELLDRINQLERERNNIILERLSALGEKIFDSVLGAAVGRIASGIYGGGSDSSRWAYDGEHELRAPAPRGGVTINVTGNTVFGERDFTKMVDNAVRYNSSLRGR